MTEPEVKSATTNALVEKLATICVEQDNALRVDDFSRYEQLLKKVRAIHDELKSRPGDQRRTLMALYDHPNFQVRLMAAKLTLAVAPDEARRQLQLIYERRHQPQSGDAGMCLWTLAEGIFRPE